MNDIQSQFVDDIATVGDEFEFDEEVEIIEDDDLFDEETETDDADTETDETKEEENKEPKAKVKQDKETNAGFAAARREAEERARKAEKERNDVFEKLGIKSASELDNFSLEFTEDEIKKLEEEAEDLGEDAEDYVLKKQMQRMVAKTKAESAVKKANEELNKKAELEIKEFNERFNVKAEDVLKDERFMEYADGKLGNKSLVEVYDKYLKFIGEDVRASQERQARRTERSTSGGQSGKGVQLTRSEAKALADWNASVEPKFRMTPSEFKKQK